MNIKEHIFGALLVGAAVLTSCSDEIVSESLSPDEVVDKGMPVLFSAGNQSLDVSRAATTLYMPNNVRFSAAMYYQESAHYNLNPWLAYLQVDEAGAGNSNYRQDSFDVPTGSKADQYGNDLDAHIFYWQNRQDHIFIGYIDNYNAAYASAKAASQSYFPDKLEEHDDFDIIENKEVVRQQMCKHFDLRNPKYKKDSEKQPGETDWTKMADQFDPLIACEEKHPAGAGDEINRVYLTFKHQLSQIQVNLKGHESVSLSPDQIDAVEMLGVSESADIFPFVDYKAVNGTSEDPDNLATPVGVEIVKYNNPQFGTSSYIRPAVATNVDLTQYTDEQIEANPYGTSFGMFPADETSLGYLKRFEAIGFGQLSALRIHWHELTEMETKDENGNVLEDEDGNPIKKPIEHIVTFVIPDENFRNLQSGMRYVFNLEIRRGTLAVINAEIDDWVPYEIEYNEEGTIKR